MNKLFTSSIALAMFFAAFAAQAETIQWTGCGITKKAFMARLAQAYKQKTGIDIQIQGGGATKGIRQVSSMSSAIGGTCRPKLVEADEEIGVQLIPVAWDALVFITHRSNPVKNITIAQAKQLFEGKLTNWKQLGGKDQPIKVFARKGKISGVGNTYRNMVYHDADKDYIAEKFFPSSGPLEKAVEAEPLAIGVTGISSARKRNVNILALEGREPSYENIQKGNYALYRPLYLAKNPLHPQRKQISDFIDFAVSREGRLVIKRSGTVPYFDALALIKKTHDQRRGELL